MAVALRKSKRFAASSPVTRYRLANCVGFSLAGGGHGTVERVLADDDPFDPSRWRYGRADGACAACRPRRSWQSSPRSACSSSRGPAAAARRT
jgi:hypothetical protein